MSTFGTIKAPEGVDKYTKLAGDDGSGIFMFVNNIFLLIGAIGGLALIFQLIMAGFSYINAQGDTKKVEAAWTKIWQSVLGLVILLSAFTIAGLVGKFLGINVLAPKIYGPNN